MISVLYQNASTSRILDTSMQGLISSKVNKYRGEKLRVLFTCLFGTLENVLCVSRQGTTETECVSILMSCYTNKMRLPLYFPGLHLYEQDVSSYMNVVPSYSESVTTFNIKRACS